MTFRLAEATKKRVYECVCVCASYIHDMGIKIINQTKNKDPLILRCPPELSPFGFSLCISNNVSFICVDNIVYFPLFLAVHISFIAVHHCDAIN